jgi:hypothetical protein
MFFMCPKPSFFLLRSDGQTLDCLLNLFSAAMLDSVVPFFPFQFFFVGATSLNNNYYKFLHILHAA